MLNEQNLSRREFCGRFVKGGLAAGVLGLTAASSKGQLLSFGSKKKPNIVLIFTDDQGIGDVSLYGSEITTPNMDSIGLGGIKFTDFYVALPICTPSRYSLLTGRYPYRAAKPFQGALMPKEPKHNDVHLADDEVTIADVLKKAGYKTALFGKWHLGHGKAEYGPNRYGFDEFVGFLPGCIDFYKLSYEASPNWYHNTEQIKEEGFSTNLITDRAVKFIEENKAGPFFLYLPYNAPHYGRCADGKLLQTPPGYPDLPAKSKDDRRVYTAMVENLDKGIGRVLATLKKLDLEENTIVIFMSDNGGDYRYGGNNRPYRGQKGQLWEGGIRTPCMIRWKGEIKAGQIRYQPGISLDLLPTLVRLAGAKLPKRKLDGIDLHDVIFKNAGTANRYLFFRHPRRKQIAVRDKKFKYVRDDDGMEYLFNIRVDPYEKNNLIAENRQQAEKMRFEYEKFMSGL